MRGLGIFFGRATRADPVRMVDPRPLNDLGDNTHSGNAGLDGYTVLSKANPDNAGDPPMVEGAIGRAYQGPDQSWEQ